MNSFKRLNTILGWVVFVIASTVYILTTEPTMSFWDCGEYITTAYKLQVGHPPGAPFFQLAGRFFSLFAFGDVALVARMVNTMSAVASGFTIMFLFWTITMIAKKIILQAGKPAGENTWPVMGAGLVGALAYTFTDSFWFSAVEGEVYGMSAFFTAIVFWAIFKWEEQADEKHAYRWLILIAYLIGLSVGVHLLNLLALPAITFVYYFRKYKVTWRGFLLTGALSIILLAVVMYLIIPWIVKLAGWFDLFFVNTIGLPFNSGTIIYALLLIGLIIWGLVYTRKKVKPVLNTIILAFTFIVIGYSTFLMLVIRSNANTPIDENNPENAIYLLAYMNREQYGDWPLFKGPYYNAPVIDRTDGNPVYSKDKASGKYIVIDRQEKTVPVYDPRFMTIFPRMWSGQEDEHIREYQRWGKVKGIPIEVQYGDKSETRNKPTFGENLRYFWNYQFNHMYWRYFMWNFVGRQNDIQGLGNKVNGNWKSGIPFIDKMRFGSKDVPESRKSKADNSFYFLPLILGLIGIYYTTRKDYKRSFVILLLFFMTGIAIVLYINQYAPQPRERDYSFAGSFYAFAIWMGLGVLQLIEWLSKKLNPRLSAILATLVCLVFVPGIMARKGWDDHDRSDRYTALAIAADYLNSCAPNAIFFANGDNDTFPLWYAQEVEEIRRDVRVVNLSLLNTEWYIDQMKRKAYESDPVPFSLTKDKYRKGNHDVTYFIEEPAFKDQYIDLHGLFSIINQSEDKLKINTAQMGTVDIFPCKKFMVPYDPAVVLKNGTVPVKYANRMDTIRWEIDRPLIEKNDLMILDLLATNDWKRPVYFVMTTGTDTYIGLEKYFQLEGMAYRLIPVKARVKEGQIGEVNTDVMYDNLMNKFKSGNMNKPGVYIDMNNSRMIMNLRSIYGRLALALIEEGKKDSALRVMDRCMEMMPDRIGSYDFFVVPMIEGYYKIGETAKANQIATKLNEYMGGELAYYFSFPDKDLKNLEMEMQQSLYTLQKLRMITAEAKQENLATTVNAAFEKYYNLYVEKVYQR